jgi:hypothetical protein
MREILYGDEQQHRALLLRQLGKAAQKIAVGERLFLPALDTGLLGLQDFGQRPVPDISPLATLVGNKPMVQNRVDPTARVAISTALVPAGERPFEAVLNKIVGTLSVTAQQSVRVSTQPGDVRLEKLGRVSGCAPRRRRAAIHRTTSNTELASGIAKCSQETVDQRPK